MIVPAYVSRLSEGLCWKYRHFGVRWTNHTTTEKKS